MTRRSAHRRRHVGEVEPAPREREPRLVDRLLGAEHDPVAVRIDARVDVVVGEHQVAHLRGQRGVRLGVDADAAELPGARDDRRAVAAAVGHAADHAVRPAGRPIGVGEDRGRGHSQPPHRRASAVADAAELAPACGHGSRHQGGLGRQQRRLGASPNSSAHAAPGTSFSITAFIPTAGRVRAADEPAISYA
jgi:hypothetical protein